MTDAQPLQFQPAATPADSAEDLARADLYGLLATLFFHAADADLLQRIAAAPLDPIGDGDIAAADAQAAASSALTQAWRKLVARAGQTTAEQADDEYTELFIGVGKPEVFLYGSYYQAGFMNEKPLVVLRDDLRRHGLGVVPHAFADHHAYRAEDFEFGSELPVLMTEKDAVKCATFANGWFYSVPVVARLPEAFWIALLERLAEATAARAGKA